MEKEKDIPFGKCPVCGEGDIIRTEFGYQCNARKESNECKCKFTIHKVQHGVELDDKLVKELITKGHTRELQMINKIGQPFNASFVIKDGKVCIELTSHYMRGKCPVCGGKILVSPVAYNCSNYGNPEIQCKFSVWRNVCGHSISKEEMSQICEEGATRQPLEMFKANGRVYYKKLGLSPDKQKIIKI